MIEPAPDHGTEVDCAEYRLKLFHGTGLSFLEALDSRIPSRPTVDQIVRSNLSPFDLDGLDPKVLGEFDADFERVPTAIEVGTHAGVKFAYGHRISWGDLKHNLDLPREVARDVISHVQGGETGQTALVIGQPGAGKTTALRRIAYNLAQNGEVCFVHQAVGNLRIDSIRALLARTRKRVLFFVDNFADYVTQFHQLRPEIESGKIAVIAAERGYRIDHIKKVTGDSFVKLFPVGKIGQDTATRLLRSYDNLGLSTVDSGDNLRRSPLKDEVIAVACCRILNNFSPVNNIIEKSLVDTAINLQECYVFAGLSNYCFRDGVEYSIISRANPGYSVDILDDSDSPLPLEVFERSDVSFVRPVNDVIADAILKRWSDNDTAKLLQIFTKVAKSIRPYVNLRSIIAGEPTTKLAARLFDYEEVVKPFLGRDDAAKFYESTKVHWDWNSRYWHQIAKQKMDLASSESDPHKKEELANIAVQHARHSRKIEPNHQFTFTMIARMLFQKMEILNKISASDFDEAISCALRAIDIERSKDRVTVHPFMILFAGLSSALGLGALTSPKQRSEIGNVIRQSFENFPRDRQLIDLATSLQARL